ncbi:hypothetical protein GGF46_004562 [Coemansia sp. RSA 552]|nr:hypothetical protein GGF46_004562 [Coemansia sp. RSA 552]
MKRTGIRRLVLPSTLSLSVAAVYFICVVLVSQSIVQSRSAQEQRERLDAWLEGDSVREQFAWKRPAPSVVEDAVETDEGPLDLEEIGRLPGWPTEFPADLEQYRMDMLNRTWPSAYARQRAEIAPWVWHRRGKADILQSDNTTMAIREMAQAGIVPHYGERARAAFVVLLRNRELPEFLQTMRQLEERFNRNYHYPYVFLNDEPFTQEFMQMVAASTTSNVTFALIPQEHWELPPFINAKEAMDARTEMARAGVIYGGSLSYRHMCRFNSGFFYKHPVLRDVDWYWRVEPGVDFYCDIPYDPFMFMQQNGKLYSFVIALKELEATIPSLWEHTLEYMLRRNITSDWMQYFVDTAGSYNMCHFWSNFEIASLNWLRSSEYESYFDFLDHAGGFFMERWGDAPVHSIAAGMLLNKSQVHFFDDIGYRHEDFGHCPDTSATAMKLRCRCPQDLLNFDKAPGSCLPRWKALETTPWSVEDSEEALRLVRVKKATVGGTEPHIAHERRRWYDVFSQF